MKVRRILLRNYRRYREAEVEFPDGVFALLGRNGSGKSTLLEALSFALFGPPAARTGKDLVRSDTAAPGDSVRVEADLDLGGQAVRIVRELRGKALAPSASVEVDGLTVVSPGAGSSEAATREMERRLGLDRDAFHTTVVAQQGDLARLAEAKPADRKRLLLRMLGIDRLERAVEEARARRNASVLALDRLRALVPDPRAAQTEAEAAAARLAEAQAQAGAAQVEAGAAEAAHAAARAEVDEVQRRVERAREEGFKLAAARAEEAHCVAAVARLEQETAQAQAASERAQALQPQAILVEGLEERLRAALLQEAARGQRLERLRYIALQRETVRRIEAELAALPALGEAPVWAAGADGLVSLETTLQSRSGELAVLEAQLQEVEARRRRLTALGPQATCPTCERPLNGQFEHLHTAVEETGRGLLVRRQETAQAVAQLRGQADRLRMAEQAEARRVAEALHLQARRSELERRLADESRRVAEMEATLAPELPNGGDVTVLRQKAAEARRAREEQVHLQALAGRLGQVAAQGAEATLKLRHAAETRAALERSFAPPDESGLQALLRSLDIRWEAARRAQQRLHHASLSVQVVQAAHDGALRRVAEARAAALQVESLEREARQWTALAGRTGGGLLDRFRDHMVGRVGPAISAEASRLLSRFSGGRYTEVLLDDDHQVFVTDHGVPYALERFSGGEADLVHLALRLAVSRLLAERGGVELRFLALDEVFGSLDRERRELVVGALQELGTLYGQVLVISHLEGLDEALGQVLRVEERWPGEAAIASS